MNGFDRSGSVFTYQKPHAFIYAFGSGIITNKFISTNSYAETEKLVVAKNKEQFGSVIDYGKYYTNMLMGYAVGNEMYFSRTKEVDLCR